MQLASFCRVPKLRIKNPAGNAGFLDRTGSAVSFGKQGMKGEVISW